MTYAEVSKAVEENAVAIFERQPNDRLLYHNIDHTRTVVQRAIEIAQFYKMRDESLFVVTAAAWFHDVGYLFVGPNNHERESVRIMLDSLITLDLSPSILDRVGQAILATKKAQTPDSLAEMILCDADTYHFGTPEFRHTDNLMKHEVELLTGHTPGEWIHNAITMLKNHQFYTSYCRQRLDEGKKQNIEWLQSLL